MVRLTPLIHSALIVGALAAFDPPCESVFDCVNRGLSDELGHTVIKDLDRDSFYNPDPSSLKVAEALRLEKPDPKTLAKYRIPPGVTMYRMIYGSRDLKEKLVPASAFILIPYTDPKGKREPLEVIAWAHGTSGIERQCAPSTQDNLYYEYEAPLSMALQGFAVIAPDYAGQGTNATFHYLHGPAHAADMSNAVKAARSHRALSGVLSKKWVAIGHSEGGLTAWATNEREAKYGLSTDGFMGAVSIAPALANLKIIGENVNRTNGSIGDTLLYPSYTLSTIKRFDPKNNVDQYYTQLGLERRSYAAFGCFNTALGAFNGLTFDQVFRTRSWLQARFAKKWQDITGVDGKRKIAKPMLIIAGEADVAVPLKVIKDAFNTQCKKHPGTSVYLSQYPRMDHDPVAWASQLEYFDWVRALFGGKDILKHEACKKGRIIETSIPSSSPPIGSGEETGVGEDVGESVSAPPGRRASVESEMSAAI